MKPGVIAGFLLALLAALALLRWLLAALEWRSLYHPLPDFAAEPSSLGLTHDEVAFAAADGTRLHGWYFPAAEAPVTVLFCHGNAGNISHRLHRARFFHELGWSVLLFDYRGYGRSRGRPSEEGLVKDAEAAYAVLTGRYGAAPERLVVYGKSLGGAVAARLCLSRPAAALVLESTFTSVPALAAEVYPFLPGWLLAHRFDSLAAVRSLILPKLILHGREDEVIPFAHGRDLAEAAAEPKQFLPFSGGHNDEAYVTSSAYAARLVGFAAEMLGRPGSPPLSGPKP